MPSTQRLNAWLVPVPAAGLVVTLVTGHLYDIGWLAVLSWVTWFDARLGAWLAQRADRS